MLKRIILPFLIPVCLFALQFTTQPSFTTAGAGQWTVTFAVSESTDVEVSIVNTADSTVVRHLAAGVLGASAPAPLTPGTFSQTLTWDGKDDLGNTVANPEKLSARVRAGMSVGFVSTIGQSMYGFTQIYGLATDDSGNLYVYGCTGVMRQLAIRQYDTVGNYVKTVFPFPPAMDKSKLTNWGINIFTAGGSYIPKSILSQFPRITNTIINRYPNEGHWAGENAVYLASSAPDGNLLVVSDNMLNYVVLGTNGEIVDNGSDLSLASIPAAPPSPLTGQVFCRLSSNGTEAFLSGLSGGTFWKPGRVCRVDMATHTARPVVTVDSNTVSFQGTALDDSGRIFICDKGSDLIRVYDTLGTLLNSFAVTAPELIEVNRTTGEIYVASRVSAAASLLSIRKFAGWRGTPVLMAELQNFIPDAGANRMFMALNDRSAKAVLWFGYYNPSNANFGTYGAAGKSGIFGFRDDGTVLTPIKDFWAEIKVPRNIGFERLAVDRRTETVFFTNSWSSLFKIEDWTNPVVLSCSTSGGPLWAGDVAVSPDRKLFVREDQGFRGMNGGWAGPVVCYTLDHKHGYVRAATPVVGSRYGAGYADKGIAIDKAGNVYINDWVSYDRNRVMCYSPTGSLINAELVSPLPEECGGIRVDLSGNIYTGAYIIGTGHRCPSGFGTDFGYKGFTGSVVKFPPTGGSIDKERTTASYLRKATNALKIYPDGFAPFSGSAASSTDCMCRSPRFDVDPYGRLFIPNAVTGLVAISDNNGTLIKRIGEYGNSDCNGPGSLIPGPSIPLAWPIGVATSEDFIYITDMNNNRLLRAKMDYVLDNIPGLTARGVDDAVEPSVEIPDTQTCLAASPNPFNPESHITVNLLKGGKTVLSVYDISGHLVKTIAAGNFAAGRHSFVWNGRDSQGKTVSAGMYVYKLIAKNRVLLLKTIFAK